MTEHELQQLAILRLLQIFFCDKEELRNIRLMQASYVNQSTPVNMMIQNIYHYVIVGVKPVVAEFIGNKQIHSKIYSSTDMQPSTFSGSPKTN